MSGALRNRYMFVPYIGIEDRDLVSVDRFISVSKFNVIYQRALRALTTH